MTDEKTKPCPICGRTGLTWIADGSRPRSHKCVPQEVPKETVAPSTGAVTADKVIEAYIKTRDEIGVLKKQFDEAVADMKILQEKRGNWLKGEMDRLGATQIGTKGIGMCFVDFKDSAKVADRGAFLQWVQEDFESREHFLENRVAKGAVKQMLEDHEGALPPGVDYVKVKDIKVRRS